MTPALYQIEDALAQLVAMREELELTDEERAAIDGQIEAWIGSEIRKVDSIRGYLRHAEMMAKAAREEASLQAKRAVVWESRIDRLKAICKLAMEAFGVKRLEGKTGVLAVRGNGGMRPLTITDGSLIPEEYCVYRGMITAAGWRALRQMLGTAMWEAWSGRQDVQMERCPLNDAVRNALDGGTVPGARLEERGTSLIVK